MKLQSIFRSSLLLLAGAVLMSSAQVSAQIDAPSSIDEGRLTADLEADVRDAVERDTDVADTALTFNNPGNSAAIVVCRAFSGEGKLLGRRMLRVPPNGVRYLRASDLSGRVDFVGSAVCLSRVVIHASAVFLAPGALTNLDVERSSRRTVTSNRFPLVATY